MAQSDRQVKEIEDLKERSADVQGSLCGIDVLLNHLRSLIKSELEKRDWGKIQGICPVWFS